ncbi:MAG: glutaredoxin family protein [Pseudomonadales bacterium]
MRILQADNSVLVGQDIEVCEIDIADSEELMAEYGIRIPVIQLESVDADIGWPFTLDQLAEYLNS